RLGRDGLPPVDAGVERQPGGVLVERPRRLDLRARDRHAAVAGHRRVDHGGPQGRGRRRQARRARRGVASCVIPEYGNPGLTPRWARRRQAVTLRLDPRFRGDDECRDDDGRYADAVPPASFSRNAFFCTLPIALRGSSRANTTRFGTLKCAISPRSEAMTDASVSAWPSLATTTASPKSASAMPTTADSTTPSSASMRSSISFG